MTNIGGGIERIDRPGHSPLYTDNKDPMMAGFLGRPAGGPSKEVTSIMQRMSDQSDAQRANRFQKQANDAQYAREVQQAQAINAAGGENARNVQNRMDQEKYLRQMDVRASGATHAGERLVNLKAYNEATKADAAVRQGSDAGSVARTQADASRYGYDTGAATSRYRTDQEAAQFGQTQGIALSRLAMEQQTAGYQNRAAAQQEGLRDQMMQEQDPIKRQPIMQRLRELQGGQTADPYLVVPGGQGLTSDDKPYTMPSAVFNRQTQQWVQQPAQPSANHLSALRANPKQAADFDAKYGAGAARRAMGG